MGKAVLLQQTVPDDGEAVDAMPCEVASEVFNPLRCLYWFTLNLNLRPGNIIFVGLADLCREIYAQSDNLFPVALLSKAVFGKHPIA